MSVLDGTGMETSAGTLGELLLTAVQSLGRLEALPASLLADSSQSGLGCHQGQFLLTQCLSIFSCFSSATTGVTPEPQTGVASSRAGWTPQQRKVSPKPSTSLSVQIVDGQLVPVSSFPGLGNVLHLACPHLF